MVVDETSGVAAVTVVGAADVVFAVVSLTVVETLLLPPTVVTVVDGA